MHRLLAAVAAIAATGLAVAACSGSSSISQTPSSVGPTPAPISTPTPVPTPTPTPSLPPSVVATAAPTLAPTPVPSDGQSAGETRIDGWGIEQVWVPAGSFTMGTTADAIAALTAGDPPDWVVTEFPSEEPAHEVRLSRGYWLDRTEVTNDAFSAFVEAGGYTNRTLWSDEGLIWLAGKDTARLPLHCQGDVPDHPRMCLTWYEAEAYATWRAGRLPTEAEWEYAARGPDSNTYPWGNRFDIDRANVVDSVGPKPVGSYPDGASWVGAEDMAGNAMEWVSDWLGETYYESSPLDDPTGPTIGSKKVEKGGWWGSNEFVARSAYRHYEDPPTYGDKHIGFRVVSQ